MPDATAADIIEGLERLFAAIEVDGPRFACVFRGNDEAGAAQRDADRVTTVVPLSDKRDSKSGSGGSCYRLLTVATGSQYHRNKLTRRKMLDDAPTLEWALRHCVAGLAALAVPVTVHDAKLLDGPRFDMAIASDATKAQTAFVLAIRYHVAG